MDFQLKSGREVFPKIGSRLQNGAREPPTTATLLYGHYQGPDIGRLK